MREPVIQQSFVVSLIECATTDPTVWRRCGMFSRRWVLNMLGANSTILLGSVSAECPPGGGPLMQHAWQHLNDGPEHAYGPVNLRTR